MSALKFKNYAVVSFLEEENAVEVIPTKWILNEKEAKWPNLSSIKMIGRCIQDRCAAAECWTTVKIRIFGYSNSFKKAKSKASKAQDTSNIGSDSSEQEARERKRKAPRKYDASDSEEEIRNVLKKKKVHQIPTTPQIIDMTPGASESQIPSHKDSGSAKSPEMSSTNFSNQMLLDYNSMHSLSATLREENLQNSLDSLLNLTSTASEIQLEFRTGEADVIEKDFQNKSTQTLLGNGSMHLPSSASSRDVAMQNDLIHSLLQVVQKLQTDITEVNKKVDVILGKLAEREGPTVFPEPLPHGISLPVKSDEDLIDLNNKLLDINLLKTLIHHLHAEGIGKSPRSFLFSLIKKIMVPDVAVLYSRLGRKGKKCFMEMKQVFKAFITATSLRFPKASKEELAELFGKALTGAASDWKEKCMRPSDVHSSTTKDTFSILDMTF